ncbi:putative Radical SAM domain protein [Rhodospirillaceae bacterium LM-1]|nr:putative Radical SAM domain protein [Rhodospirillaceae bacterium LM-1]
MVEFMDISLLTGHRPTEPLEINFALLKTLPRIQVTMDLKLVQTQENLEALRELEKAGNLVVNIAKQPPTKSYEGRKDFPRRVLLEMTSECNVLCRMCPRNDFRRPVMHMEADTYCRVLREINDHGVEGLWAYHLGESMMHPDFRKIIRSMDTLDDLGYVWMSTNGHLFNQSNADFVLESRLDYINFSLHAISEAAFKYVSPQGDFKTVLANYEYLKSKKAGRRLHRPFVHLQMIEQEGNKHETSPFIAAHYDEVEIVSVNMLEYANLPKNTFGMVQRPRKPRGHCTRVNRNDCFICSNGAVTLCDFAYNCEEKHVGPLYLGNINDEPLHDIWNGERRAAILSAEREGLMNSIPLCQTCTDYDI